MAEELVITVGSKEEKYTTLLPQLKALCSNEPNYIANLANIAAAIHQTFSYFWVGFYHVDAVNNELVLGPFQGPIACTRIKKGKGVCGTAWAEKRSVLVKDVNQFEQHIACNAFSQSEIVVPIVKENTVIGVLDIDHSEIATFDEVDLHYLNEISSWISSDIL